MVGFCSDWCAHWRWMGLELGQLCHTIGKAPGHSLRTCLLHPLHFAFWWFIAALYIDGVTSVVTERTGYQNSDGTTKVPPLRDQGFSFPFFDSFDLPNQLLYITVGVTTLRFLPLWPFCKPAMFRTIARRWLFLEGIIFWYRAVSVVITSSPYPDASCVSTATGSVWSEGVKITFGVTHTCGDCMFSGHTAAITLLMMIWSHYSRGEEFAVCFGTCQGILTSNVDAAGDPMGWKFLDFLLYAWMLMCMYFIIATRFHYSHDVFVGFVITYLLFHAYHFYVKSLAMRQGSLFARFMRWFEGVNLDADTLERATLDCDTGTGHAILGSSAATAEAIRAGMEMTKNNRMFCVKRTAVAALPVSYLEGNNYYRVGGDNTKLTHLHPDAAANAAAAARCNHSNGHTAAPAATTEMATMPPPLVKPEGGTDNDASVVGARFSHSPPGTQIDGFEHDTTVRIHTHHDAAATAAAAAAAAGSPGHGLPVEHAHNEQLPIPILVTGEAAAQEEREVRTSPDMV